MQFICPKCSLPLTIADGGTARCENGHCYDRARAGYYNLLLSNVGGTHGDNREMVEARRSFLESGAYEPLALEVARLAKKYIHSGSVLDIGCGEGYYTDVIARALAERGVTVSAFDISRDAVKLAHKRNSSISLAVASAYKMPVADGSFSGAVNMFSPLAADEVCRSLCEGGIFIMSIPAENHLFGLKKATYKTPYKNEVADKALSGFELVDESSVSYELTLDSNDKIRSLFMMTPYAYRTGKEDRERVLSLDKLKTEVDFLVLVYKKR